ncbi:4-hydroxythreonine-4-phosphate dehydrogenase PdxA [Luteimonas sp. BDR2-5]|uniref:4-hydroxythreonine-4-phosphate dehydrogenase PdxA n=1 Tax=Proluteimonas luteida TaxID=2878685 RepID=UPI001E550B45|nr:4-hydroxythreonine-4-phosphate dehydrogenase PdxA [Luteimonas sp. BDR2-5]MCD9028911.1 4-hydroxythreonine-4-phosphate dehydrogenase PdxA [Luteimonas sp. BDR2-5]
MPRPRLALVPGEPAGVGPELCVRAACRQWDADLVAIGDAATLRRAAAAIDLPLVLVDAEATDVPPGTLRLIEFPHARLPEFGEPAPDNARSIVDGLLHAAAGCRQGRFDGMVTGPVHKAAINAGGIAYSGTTELLAEDAGCDVVMMLANPTLRVALATTHLPLRAVPDAITTPLLERVLQILDHALREDFGITAPAIAVLGLNPHAGENGHLGHEEDAIIAPLLSRLRGTGMTLDGPLPADTAFLPARLAGIDAVLAMYHDQGLPVLKYSGFESAVNLTLGLPYPRVAVDHGTALDLAGSGRADPSSLFAAIAQCTALARQRMRRSQGMAQ